MTKRKITEEIAEFLDNFWLRIGDELVSVNKLPFTKLPDYGKRSIHGEMFAEGLYNGDAHTVFMIDLWDLKLPSDGKPTFLVHAVNGSWMELRNPADFYLENMKVVMVAAYFLISAKQSPMSSKGEVWRFIRKECRGFKAQPNLGDLEEAYQLIKSMVLSDSALQKSPILPQFFPALSYSKIKEEVIQRTVCTRSLLSVKQEAESPRKETKVVQQQQRPPSPPLTPPEGDVTRGNSSEPSTPDSDSNHLENLVGELTRNLPALNKTPAMVKEQPRSSSSRKKQKRAAKRRKAKNDDGVDEPDVCMFCDDGVVDGDYLICCDGGCMRSFHPSYDSGRLNKCPTLGLPITILNEKSWICHNCEARQHQCFACGELGNSDTTSPDQTVFVCGAKKCKRFYHPKCVAKLLAAPEDQEELENRIQEGLETFVCPLHRCSRCLEGEDKNVIETCLVKCRRCPVAWHKKCLPQKCEEQLREVGGKYVMYCGRHILDPELQTPPPDHIIFPDVPVSGISIDAACRHRRVYAFSLLEVLHGILVWPPHESLGGSPLDYGNSREYAINVLLSLIGDGDFILLCVGAFFDVFLDFVENDPSHDLLFDLEEILGSFFSTKTGIAFITSLDVSHQIRLGLIFLKRMWELLNAPSHAPR